MQSEGNNEEEATGESVRRISGRKKALLVGGGVVAAGVLAVMGGMLLGEYASVPGVRADDDAAPARPSVTPTPAPTETIPIRVPRPALPSVAVAVRLASDAGRTAIMPESWVRQQDFPREMYGSTAVEGMIVTNITVAPDGSVSACAIAGSSEVRPPRMLNASATGVCRALQRNARFEPLAASSETGGDDELVDPDLQNPTPSPTETSEKAPWQSEQVTVRVIFRTMQMQSEDAAPE